MRRTLLAAALLGCRSDKNDLGVPKGCPPQFDDPDPVIREGIRRRLNELDLPPYASKAVLASKLHIAIESGAGFGFV